MEDLSLHILDIVQNSFTAKSSIVILNIEENIAEQYIKILIEDNGIGMDEDTITEIQNPFYTTRTTRKVGLGIPLFKQTLEQTGGYLKIISKINQGTKIEAKMLTSSIDAIPLGNIAETLWLLSINQYNCDINFKLVKSTKEIKEYEFNTLEIKNILEDVSLCETVIANWLKDYIETNLNLYMEEI